MLLADDGHVASGFLFLFAFKTIFAANVGISIIDRIHQKRLFVHLLVVSQRLVIALIKTTYYGQITEKSMTNIRLTFKEMCAKFDVTPRTLRYYEYIELLSPEREGRSRFYGNQECARMTLILRGRRFGFSLEDIRQWLLIYEKEGTQAQMKAWVELADQQLSELDDQRKQLDETIVELRKLRDDTRNSIN